MEAKLGLNNILTTSIVVVAITITVLMTVRLLMNLLWFRPRKLEKFLRQQGLCGSPYRPFLGDLKDLMNVMKAEQHRSIELSDDILPHVLTYYYQILTKYGENSFLWFGPWPRLNITDPELIREILRKHEVFQRPFQETAKILIGANGVLTLVGEKWAKHRKIINPAFHTDKLKNMVPAIGLSCSNMIEKWKTVVSGSNQGFCEIDVWPYLQSLTGDVISRTAFGSSYEEGARIFQLQREKLKLTLQVLQFICIPGWRYVPTKVNRKEKAISKEIQSILRGMIEERQKAMDRGEAISSDDLLGTLMESNSRLIQEQHGNKNAGITIEEVIEECKLFYFAGSETTSSLLVWTMILLCKHPEWQTKAREEVIRVFGNSAPTYEGLNHLKIVTMILQESLRLYPPVPILDRATTETLKLGKLTLPKGVHLTLLIGLLHYDSKIWGDDAKEFNPERFSEGISNAAKIQSSFIPFSLGQRVCIGQNFAMIEAKMAVAMILQHFSFELSPSYRHAPFQVVTLQPQYGAPIILHSLDD